MRTDARRLVDGARAAIEAHRTRIDDLNVYPVPDGDTGTNLTLTVRAVADSLAGEGADDRAGLAREVSRAALMGARGNSGVILSQIVRGATESLAGSDDLAAAFRSASDAAYRAVKKPVEGTMLTAVRAMADAAGRGASFAEIVAAGDETVVATREMLPVLREAGVVDAGAAGLLEIVRGLAAALAGEALPETPGQAGQPGQPGQIAFDAIHRELSRYRYCTVFVVEGHGLDVDELETELEDLGDSLLVVGDPSALKVHVHTDDPGRALSLGVARGIVGGVEIANMHAQAHEREERLLHAVRAPDRSATVVAVAAGAGNRELFESFGATVVDGGSTMNPATAELLAAIEAAGTSEVVLLPNNANVLMAAEQAAEHSSKRVRVVPTASLQAGLVAVVAFDPTSGAEANADAMAAAVEGVATGAVTIASREVRLNGVAVRSGAWLGLAEGEPVAGGESFEEVARAVLDRLLAEPRGVLTLLTGDEPPALDSLLAELAGTHPELELDVHAGGQPHYPLLLAAE
ncbi:MAG: DAK2 domain-containing protein [Gaiellaceae bacterium]